MQLENLKTIGDVEVDGKSVVLRLDLNVPMRDGRVSDDTRLVRCLPTIKSLVDRGAKVVMMSHMGRPKGARNALYSLKPVAERMSDLLGGQDVLFFDDCIDPELPESIRSQSGRTLILVENLRFHEGEEKNDPAFARKLSELGDIYVNDAFSSSHRAHASIVGITEFLPSYAGPQLMAEISALRSVLEDPEKPVVALVGGAKVSTKIPVLTNLMSKVDVLIIGGGMANTFLFAQGYPVGKSLCETDYKDTAVEILQAAEERNCEIVLPIDVVTAADLEEGAENFVFQISEVPADQMILDVGPESVVNLGRILSKCRTLLWNGPLGAFEISPFGAGTFTIAREAGAQTVEGNLVSVAGGGDTVAALNQAGVEDKFTYVSTAGGAFLEWLEGRDLPGIVALA